MNEIFAAFIVFSSSILLNVPNSHSYDIREPLPETGYWNYLPILGLWGRVAHHFITDTDGVGTEVKMLDSIFKDEYGTDKYVTLERDVVNTLPKAIIFYRLLEIMENLKDVRDPETGKTLGDAVKIFKDLQNNPSAIQEYETCLGLPKPDLLGFHSSTSSYYLQQTLKNAILQNPLVVIEVLEDPQIDNFLTGTILDYLSSDKFSDGLKNVQNTLKMVDILYSNSLDEKNHPILAIKDSKSKMSLSTIIKALLRVVHTSEFADQLKSIFASPEMRAQIHENTQGTISRVIKQNKPYRTTVKDFINKLKPFHIEITYEGAERLLEAAKSGDLDVKAAQFLEQLSQVPDLDAKKISKIITDEGVEVSPQMVTDAIDSLVHFPPEMISAILKSLGLPMQLEQVKGLLKIVKKMKAEYDAKHNGGPRNESSSGLLDEDNDELALKGEDEEVASEDASQSRGGSSKKGDDIGFLSYSA